VPKIKGSHTAMKSGMLAAEAAFEALAAGTGRPVLDGYTSASTRAGCTRSSMPCAMSARPSNGACAGHGLERHRHFVLRGKAPWTLAHHGPDHQS
jgi:electron-transferring-flavoprotein dehydrogenase